MKQKTPFMKLFLFVSLLFAGTMAWAQTPVPMASQPGLTYTENFADITNWTNGFAAGIGANRWASVGNNTIGTVPNATTIINSTATFQANSTSTGVQKGTGRIQFLGTGTTDNSAALAIDFLMDFTSVNASNLSFEAATVVNGSGNRVSTLHVYATTDNVNWTELTGT